jgi:hypothetical protein
MPHLITTASDAWVEGGRRSLLCFKLWGGGLCSLDSESGPGLKPTGHSYCMVRDTATSTWSRLVTAGRRDRLLESGLPGRPGDRADRTVTSGATEDHPTVRRCSRRAHAPDPKARRPAPAPRPGDAFPFSIEGLGFRV